VERGRTTIDFGFSQTTEKWCVRAPLDGTLRLFVRRVVVVICLVLIPQYL